MAKVTKTLTIPNLISAMKQAGFVTNDSLEKRLRNFATKDDLKSFATKDDLKSFATKDDLNGGLAGLRKQINDDQFEARAEFYAKMTKPAMEEMETNLRTEIAKVDKKLDSNTEKLSFEISGIKDDLNGLTAEFSTHHHTNILKN